MKLTGIGTTSATGRARRGDKADGKGGAEFARHLDSLTDGPDEAQGLGAAAPMAGLGALLSVQAVPDSLDGEARRRMQRRGEDLLERLEDIRRGLLLGTIPMDRLIDLARLVRSRRETVQDPLLMQVLDEIELRAEVEIAKLSRRP